MEVPSSAWLESAMPTLAKVKKEAPAPVRWRMLNGRVKHVFSHFELELTVAVGSLSRPLKGRWVSSGRLSSEALPSVMRKILRHAMESE